MTLEADAGDRLVVARTLQMEVVARGPVRDLELVGGGLELLHLLAIELQRDREAGSDGAVDRLRSRGGGAGTDHASTRAPRRVRRRDWRDHRFVPAPKAGYS